MGQPDAACYALFCNGSAILTQKTTPHAAQVTQALEIFMKTLRQKLVDHLECYGWDIELVDEVYCDWWADEIWKLKSHWSPRDTIAFITALVDPQHEGNRKKGESVWAYGLSKAFPRTTREAGSEAVLSTGKMFNQEVESFIDRVLDIRDAAKNF